MSMSPYFWSLSITPGMIRDRQAGGMSLAGLQDILTLARAEVVPSRHWTRIGHDSRPGNARRYVRVGQLTWGEGAPRVWENQGGSDLDTYALYLAGAMYLPDVKRIPREATYSVKGGRALEAGHSHYANVVRWLDDGEEYWTLEEQLGDVIPRALAVELESLAEG
ncbi:hypothetical protein EJ997_10495 [Flaviflexus ciconiae]|uniref:Uncharacterized protein n=1 Tax=Flaviflexus ciconiae TaxID=2496867 RepID=A0A3Q9G574_9ACTO|nr:hypothetical protein [Flaviflexus ciconiae]AZQ77707.1 hypothetical protein EJ997_10495 [Flaviflexus ciconiae]